MMISVNTDIFHPAANPFSNGVAPVSAPDTSVHTSFNLQNVLASQAPGHQAITAEVNPTESLFGGWTHLLGYSGGAADIAQAQNANYKAIGAGARVPVPATGNGPGGASLSFWQQLKASLFGAAQRAGTGR